MANVFKGAKEDGNGAIIIQVHADGSISAPPIPEAELPLGTSLPASPGVTAIKEAGGQVLTVDAVTDGQSVKRVGTTLVGYTPTDVTPLTTKGDLFGYNTADARIPVGTNGQVLTADSAQALGLKWADAAGGGSSPFAQNGSTLTAATTVALPDGFDTFVISGTAAITTLGVGSRVAGAEATIYVTPTGIVSFNSIGGNLRLGGATSQAISFTNDIGGGDTKGFLYRFKLVNIPSIGLKWCNTSQPIALDDNS